MTRVPLLRWALNYVESGKSYLLSQPRPTPQSPFSSWPSTSSPLWEASTPVVNGESGYLVIRQPNIVLSFWYQLTPDGLHITVGVPEVMPQDIVPPIPVCLVTAAGERWVGDKLPRFDTYKVGERPTQGTEQFSRIIRQGKQGVEELPIRVRWSFRTGSLWVAPMGWQDSLMLHWLSHTADWEPCNALEAIYWSIELGRTDV